MHTEDPILTDEIKDRPRKRAQFQFDLPEGLVITGALIIAADEKTNQLVTSMLTLTADKTANENMITAIRVHLKQYGD